MIVKLKSIEELKSQIEKDIYSNIPNDQRYPIRIIFTNKIETFQHVVKMLQDYSKISEIYEIFGGKDRWVTSEEIKLRIEKLDETTTFLPFGEFLRFTDGDTYTSLINTIYEIENNDHNRRIYLPILGMKNEFEKRFADKYHRKDFLLPIWHIDESYCLKTEVFLIDERIKTNKKTIDTTSQWMRLWEINHDKKIISKSKVLKFLYTRYSPDPIFNFTKIDNYKQYIESVLLFNINFDYIDRDFKMWEILSQHIENEKFTNYEDFITFVFNVRDSNLTIFDIVNIWFNFDDDYYKWILKNHFSCSNSKNGILSLVMVMLDNFTNQEFIKTIWFLPFKEDISKDMLLERSIILNYIHITKREPFAWIEKELENIISLTDKEKIHNILTGITNIEKKYIIENFNDFNNEEIKTLYNDLFDYLYWSIKQRNESWIIEYFNAYNYSKIKNEKQHNIDTILSQINENDETFYKWYYDLKKATNTNVDQVYWIDGLGAEWYPFIIECIIKLSKESQYSIASKELVRVDIPTTTDNNRIPNSIHICELDQYIHSKTSYHYPNDLIDELKIIKKIMTNILTTARGNTISITSDHGFSFLCRKEFGNTNTRNFENDNHEGRCMMLTEDLNSDKDFISHVIENGTLAGQKCIVSLNHKSLNKIPSREVHGGATPEEVIVPNIILKKKNQYAEYKSFLMSKNVKVSDKEVKFKIYPKPATLPMMIIGSMKTLPSKIVDDEYYFPLNKLLEGKYNCVLEIDGLISNHSIEIAGGISTNEMF
jgi:hypothetical protein